jgi:hypothetical protein
MIYKESDHYAYLLSFDPATSETIWSRAWDPLTNGQMLNHAVVVSSNIYASLMDLPSVSTPLKEVGTSASIIKLTHDATSSTVSWHVKITEGSSRCSVN